MRSRPAVYRRLGVPVLEMQSILTFQRRFLRAAFVPGVEIAALSLPRGNAKSTIAARLLARSMRPGSRLFVAGADNKLIAGKFSTGQGGVPAASCGAWRGGLPIRGFSNQSTKVLHVATRSRGCRCTARTRKRSWDSWALGSWWSMSLPR